MAQRHSEYERIPDEAYPTPAWVTRVLTPFLKVQKIKYIWEPAPGAQGKMVRALRSEGFTVFAGSRGDFLNSKLPNPKIQALITNPPFGGGGKLGRLFIEHALTLDIDDIYMLLRVDFDSARTRQHLFGQCPTFAGKIVLLN